VGHSTRAVSRSVTGVQARNVRRGFAGTYNTRAWFGRSWYGRYPNAWRARRWTAATFWTAATVSSLYTWWGWGAPVYGAPVYGGDNGDVYYDYGNTIVYEGDDIYYGGQPVAKSDKYYDEAQDIAEQGDEKVDDEAEWRSLGVFAMVQDDEKTSNKILQLAVNKDGVIRGNYYDALTETTLPIEGSVDKKSKRAAWTVGDNKDNVYETGVNNLTQDETQMLVHFGKKTTQQWMLVRLEEPDESDKDSNN
jgi:hypothetical protein